MNSSSEVQLNYIHKHLVAEILNNLQETLQSYDVQRSVGLDGFMSAIYHITLWSRTRHTSESRERHLIAKFMKGDSNFRQVTKSYIQFANEVFIYDQVLPLFRGLLHQAAVFDISVEKWVARCYIAKFGYIEGLSSSPTDRDAVLVLTNLKPNGYKLGPRLYLRRDHLLKMTEILSQYHAMSYVLRLHSAPRFEQLKASIVTLPFCNEEDPNDDRTNLYKVLYRAAFDRFFQYLDRVVDDTFDLRLRNDVNLLNNLRRLREKYFAHPTRLLEHLRTSIELMEEDRRFGAILHGDYNRNNVLFRYKQKHQPEDLDGIGDVRDEVGDAKMIDFQELRYGSPAIDLSFYMYMNTTQNARDEMWPEILECYHSYMFHTLASVLPAITTDGDLKLIEEKLLLYGYVKFYNHFCKFAFYGALVCMHFLPWMLCSEEERNRLSHLFVTDMHGEEFHQLSIDAGGDLVNEEIMEIMRHASHNGYMDYI